MSLKMITLALLACIASVGFSKDASHYPEDGTAAHSSQIVGVFEGRYNTWIPLSLQLGLDQTFSPSQQKLIQESVKIFVERSLSKRVLSCAFNNASKDRPSSRHDFEEKLSSALGILNVNDTFLPSFGFIARFWDDPRSVGIGYVGLFYDEDKPMPGFHSRHYLHIALNSDHLGEQSSYRYANDTDYWAGVIGHEFLHNLGYQHPTGYAGSFIQEYGRCLQHNGTEAAEAEGVIYDKEVQKEL